MHKARVCIETRNKGPLNEIHTDNLAKDLDHHNAGLVGIHLLVTGSGVLLLEDVETRPLPGVVMHVTIPHHAEVDVNTVEMMIGTNVRRVDMGVEAVDVPESDAKSRSLKCIHPFLLKVKTLFH